MAAARFPSARMPSALTAEARNFAWLLTLVDSNVAGRAYSLISCRVFAQSR